MIRIRLRDVATLPLLLAGLAACVGANPPVLQQQTPLVQQPAAPRSALLRLTLVPADIERSIAFYRDVLGYSVGFDGDISQPDNRVLLGLVEGERARFVVLRGADQLDGEHIEAAGIGLLTIEGRGDMPSLAPPADNSFAAGQPMLAVQTSDIAAVTAAARRFGAPFLVERIEAETRRGREAEIVIADPDGMRIHVVQLFAEDGE